MKKFLISTVILILAACTANKRDMVGKWKTKSSPEHVLTGVFKSDQTYEGYMNDTLFTKGTYSFKDNVFKIEHDEMTSCADTKGSYKITFTADTVMRFDVINDSCKERNEGTNGMVLVRVKE